MASAALSFLVKVSVNQIKTKMVHLLSKLLGVVAGNHIQDKQVGNGIGRIGVLLQSLVQGGLGLFCPSEVEFADCLRDEASH